MIKNIHFNLITVLAFIFMVNFGEGSWTGFDTFLSIIGVIVGLKCLRVIAEFDWFAIFLSSAILAISLTNLLYFVGQYIEPIGNLLVAVWGDNEFWLFLSLTGLLSAVCMFYSRIVLHKSEL